VVDEDSVPDGSVSGGSVPDGAVSIVGDGLTATIVPARGGKIVSLQDARGYEWLAGAGEHRMPPARRGTAFLDADMCGWDECAPTISACTLPDGTELPDHGELWDTGWDAAASILSTRGRALPYRFERSIAGIAGGLRFDYTVTADERMPFLWAPHPQFLAPPGTRVLMDAGRVVDALSDDSREAEWTAELASIDSIRSGGCRKVYAGPDELLAEAAIEVSGRGTLSFRWDPAIVPYLGVWFDNACYSREPVIALEPSTGFYDSTAAALAANRVMILEPGRPVSWSLEVIVR
jgi:hypothetical protein